MDQFISAGTTLLAASEGGKHSGTSYLGLFVYFGLVLAVIFGLMAYAKNAPGGLKSRVFTNWAAQCFEQVYLFVESMCVSIIGSHGRKYVPMIFTFWVVIFVGNLVALFFPTSVTADMSFNLGLALISIMYVQWEGIKANGFFGHFGHFAGPKLAGAMVIVSGLIFLIEIISEVMKNVSLSLRLYGNIEGGHMVTDALSNVGAKLIPLGDGTYIGFPFGALLLPVKMMTVVIQALIFTLLTCVYLSLVTHHEDEGGHADHDADHGHATPAAA